MTVVVVTWPCVAWSHDERGPYAGDSRGGPFMTALKLILEVIHRNQGGRSVLSVIVEAVAGAVNQPGLLKEHDVMMRSLGFVRSANPHDGPEVVDPADAGFVQPRKRLALVYDHVDVVVRLGHALPLITLSVFRQTIRDILDPVDVLLDNVGVRPRAVKVLVPVLRKYGPVSAAVLTIGGAGQPVVTGSKVRVASDPSTWRVISIDDTGRLNLLDHGRGTGVRWLVVVPGDVSEHVEERKMALSLDGQLRTEVARLGAPPEGPGKCLIVDDRVTPTLYRPLSAGEVWRAQGLSNTSFLAAKAAAPELDEVELAGLAGDSIHVGGFAEPVARRVVGRLVAYRALTEAGQRQIAEAAERLQRWFRTVVRRVATRRHGASLAVGATEAQALARRVTTRATAASGLRRWARQLLVMGMDTRHGGPRRVHRPPGVPRPWWSESRMRRILAGRSSHLARRLGSCGGRWDRRLLHWRTNSGQRRLC